MMGAVALLVCTLSVIQAQNPPDMPAPVDAHGFRVRAMDGRARDWIAQGIRQSSTFRTLLGRLAASDVIVYVEIVDRIAGGAAAPIYFVTTTATARYLRIELVAGERADEMVALVGHELQHAVEIAEARHVRSSAAVAVLYLAMSENSLNRGHYDSIAARVAEARIRSEVASSQATLAVELRHPLPGRR